MSVLRLAVPTPLRRYFDYLPPEGMDESQLAVLPAGIRLRVPFGNRQLTGWLVEVRASSDLPPASLKRAGEILDQQPLFSPTQLELFRWAAEYYHHSPGEVITAGLPKRLRQGKPHQALGEPAWRLSTRGKGLPEGALARSPKQALALAMLQREPVVTAEDVSTAGISRAIMRALADKDLIEPCTIAGQAAQFAARPGLKLTDEQSATVEAVDDTAGKFSCHLLEGVTGSGKTEVYLQLIDRCLQRGQQALVLIPEIGLTPQTLGRFQQRFDARIEVFHSGLSEGERYRAWESARDGSAHIVIGTRSAVFTPLPDPGLIIVDEEHDLSYKQQDGFRYSARDVAVKRGQLEQCPVLLGSATPSLESIHNTEAGRYRHHQLLQRAGSGTLPEIEVLDIRKQELHAGLSAPLLDAAAQALQRGEQVLLFLNRRGYAPTLQCHDCGWLGECDACDARLTVHRRRRQLRCHHCGACRPLPSRCPQCKSSHLLAAGLGTEQTEDYLQQRFAGWPVHRVDSDSMQAKSAMQELVSDVNSRQACILLGTQMLTKGHHFPGVSLVAVIDADALLFSTDFRGEERMAQLLTQVAGRAGRDRHSGRVLLQTHYPDHPALQAMLSHSYAQQARELLKRRQAAGLPPAGQMLLLRSDCGDPETGEQFLSQLRRQLAPQLSPGCAIIGPLPSPMQRRAGKFRFQLTLTAGDRRAAWKAAALIVAIASSMPTRRGLNWSLDIDPQELF